MSNHTTGSDMADEGRIDSPDTANPSSPELMQILEELWFEGYFQHNDYGLADSKQRTMHVEKALTALQAYINKVIGEDVSERAYDEFQEGQVFGRNELRAEQRKRAGL